MMQEEKKATEEKKEQELSLNDDRRVKVLSPGALVAKRFFRNRLAVVGLTMLVVMFVFSFIGGLVSPYGQDEQFYTYTHMDKEYVGVEMCIRDSIKTLLVFTITFRLHFFEGRPDFGFHFIKQSRAKSIA